MTPGSMTPGEALERTQWDTFWVPSDVRVIDRPDLLVLTCPRPAPYLNTVQRTRTADVPGAIAEVEGLFSGRRGRWLVPDTFDTAPLVTGLAAAGWEPGNRHEARVLAVDAWSRAPAVEVHAVDSIARLRDCVAVAGAGFGRPDTSTDEELARDLRELLQGGRVHRFVSYVDGVPAASGGLTAFPDLGFGFLWAGATVPGLRGRGAYAAVLAARVLRARTLGLAAVGLYGRVETSAPIVARLGFEHVGEMTYWEREVP